MNRLVITADDFGYSVPRNEGIVRCFQAGAITRTSLLVTGNCVQDAVGKMREHRKMCVGLHLNVTEGEPLTKAGSLVDGCGHFLDKFALRKACEQGKIDMEDFRGELMGQIDKFQHLCGKMPAYVDGHQHAHVLPGLAEVFAQYLASRGVLGTRLPFEAGMDRCTWVEEGLLAFLRDVCKDSLAAREVFSARGLHFSDAFTGSSTMGQSMTAKRIQERIMHAFGVCKPECNGNKTIELMVHPGYKNTSSRGGCAGLGPDRFDQSDDREHEMRILIGGEIAEFYAREQIELVP